MTDETLSKICTKCGELKPLVDYQKNTASKDGRQSQCRTCRCANAAAKAKANPEAAIQARKRYEAAHPEAVEQSRKKYAAKTVEKRRARARARYAANPEVRRTQKEYVDANIEKVRAYGRAWYGANTSKCIAAVERRRARKLDLFVEDVSLAVLYERDGGICQICKLPVTLPPADHKSKPSIDHVIPLSKQGEHSYANTQLAHQGCNSSKGAKLPEAA